MYILGWSYDVRAPGNSQLVAEDRFSCLDVVSSGLVAQSVYYYLVNFICRSSLQQTLNFFAGSTFRIIGAS
jgi:hypothetical protein